MENIQITPIHAFEDNYIWCINNYQQKTAVVVDPGDALPVIDFLQAYNFQLIGILVTHHHYDHTDGISKLLTHAPSIPVYGPCHSPCKLITSPLVEGNQINIMDLPFSVIEIPGHTLDHIAYYYNANKSTNESAEKNLLFCGDTLFMAGCGRIFEGSFAQMHDSLQHLMSLPEQTLAYPTHEYSLANLAFAQAVEPDNTAIQQAIASSEQLRLNNQPTLPTTLAQEAQINPFVRCHVADVIAAAKNYQDQDIRQPSEVFTALRKWKNEF